MPISPYREQEFWNTGSHGLGFLLGLIGSYFLHFHAQNLSNGGFWSVWIYSLSILFLFAASTAYHWVVQPSLKRRLR